VRDTLRLLRTVITAGVDSIRWLVPGLSHRITVKEFSIECTPRFEKKLDVVLTCAQIKRADATQIQAGSRGHKVCEVIAFRVL
jgi:hypothetical protein